MSSAVSNHGCTQRLHDSAGAAIQCQALTANKASINSNGGSISLGRLVGQQCELDSQTLEESSAKEPATPSRYELLCQHAFSEAVVIDERGAASVAYLQQGQ